MIETSYPLVGRFYDLGRILGGYALALFCIAFGFVCPAAADPETRAPYEATKSAVENCFMSERLSQKPMSCVGKGYHACSDAQAGKLSHAGESQCVYQEFLVWRQIYQTEVLLRLNFAHELDKDSALVGDRASNAFFSAINAERDWQEHMLSDCQSEMSKWGAGTVTMTDHPYCLIRKTIKRIVYLRDLKPERENR